MIEVEKRFKPTEEQLEKLLADSIFVEKKINHDVYYDFPDDRLFRNYVKFRSRNGNFEIKIEDRNLKNKNIKAELEIEDEEEIKKYFKTYDLKDFIKNNLVEIIDYKYKRKKYKKDEFTIDIDKTDFGFEVCEIELMVNNKEKVEEAKEKIKALARGYRFENQKSEGKRIEYLRNIKPEVYKILFPNEVKEFKFKMK